MLGIRDAGLYSWELVTLAVIGLDHGLWSTARGWAELQAGAQEYISISPSDRPTFSELWASIASELSVDVATVDLDSSEKKRVFRDLGSAVESKFERLGMARWFGYAESNNQEPRTKNQEPTTNNQQPTANNQQQQLLRQHLKRPVFAV